jgi:Ni/Co efflux regulator RcnB
MYKGLLLLAAIIFFTPSLFAVQPEDTGQGNSKDKVSKSQSKKHKNQSNAVNIGVYFNDNHRKAITKFYSGEFESGHCPPGLAKKNNGCLPPGQAKKWRRGQPIPSDVIYYDLPATILKELGHAPEGYKFVRVAADILLIAIGTGIVVDAIEDLADVL